MLKSTNSHSRYALLKCTGYSFPLWRWVMMQLVLGNAECNCKWWSLPLFFANKPYQPFRRVHFLFINSIIPLNLIIIIEMHFPLTFAVEKTCKSSFLLVPEHNKKMNKNTQKNIIHIKKRRERKEIQLRTATTRIISACGYLPRPFSWSYCHMLTA